MFIGSMNFFDNFFDKFEVNMKLWYDLLQDNDELRWNIELETMFQKIRTSFYKRCYSETNKYKQSIRCYCRFYINW